MSDCDLRGSCFFYNELTTSMPKTTEYLICNYCRRDFAKCVIYRISKCFGMDRVPKYLYPDDMFATLNFNLGERGEHQGGTNRLTKVIFPDGTSCKVTASSIGGLMKFGNIVAYQCSAGWVEVRRKRNLSSYKGPERRNAEPERVPTGCKP